MTDLKHSKALSRRPGGGAFAFCTRIKNYRVLRKESKTLGRDILYVGFPMAALDRTLGNAMTRKVNDTTIDVVLSYPMNENEFLQ